jgi:hypothetical protein
MDKGDVEDSRRQNRCRQQLAQNSRPSHGQEKIEAQKCSPCLKYDCDPGKDVEPYRQLDPPEGAGYDPLKRKKRRNKQKR